MNENRSTNTARKKRQKIMALVIAFFGVCLLLVGCGTVEAYSKLSIDANIKEIVLPLEVRSDASGNIYSQTEPITVTISVRNLPSAVQDGGPDFFLTYDDKVVNVQHSSTRADQIVLTAISSGSTEIVATTRGGNKSVAIKVTVDVPARSMALNRGAHLAVYKGSTFKISNDYFKFYSTSLQNETPAASEPKNIRWSLASSAPLPLSCGFSTETQILSVPNTSSVAPGKYAITAYLNDIPFEFPVYILEDINASAISFSSVDKPSVNLADREKPVVEFILNGTKTSIDAESDNRLTAKINAGSNYYKTENLGTTWGYSIATDGARIVKVEDYKDSTFRLSTGSDVGTSDVDVSLFPIFVDPILGEIRFTQDDTTTKDWFSHLRRNKSLKVEVRNVFPNDSLEINDRAGNTITQLCAFYADQYNMTELLAARQYFNVVLKDEYEGLNINFVENKSKNNHIAFEFAQVDGSGRPIATDGTVLLNAYGSIASPLDIFNITYNSSQIIDPLSDKPLLADSGTYSNKQGVPYYYTFSIALKNNTYANKTIELRARTVYTDKYGSELGEPLADAPFTVQCLNSIKEAKPYSKENEAISQVRENDTLYFVRNGSREATVYLRTEERALASLFEFNLGDEFVQKSATTIGEGLIHKFVFGIKQGENPILGQAYNISGSYRNGLSVSLKFITLDAIASPTIDIAEYSGAQIYQRTAQSGGYDLIAFIKISALYELTFSPALPYYVEAQVTNPPQTLTVEGRVVRFSSEGIFDLNINLYAPNDEIVSGSYVVRIVVINPIEYAEFDTSGVKVNSYATLGREQQDLSKSEFSLILRYFDNINVNKPATLNYTLDISFNFSGKGDTNAPFALTKRVDTISGAIGRHTYTLQGYYGTGGKVDLVFNITQNFIIGGQPFSIEYSTSGKILPVEIVDVVQVESIATPDVGTEYLSITINRDEDNGALEPAKYVLTTSISPLRSTVFNPSLGFALTDHMPNLTGAYDPSKDFTLSSYRNSIDLDRYATINRASGEMSIYKNNIGKDSIFLVVWANDSVKTGQYPTTYIAIQVFIYNLDAKVSVKTISTASEFLSIFYNEPIYDGGVLKYYSRDPYNPNNMQMLRGYYQLVKDIDLGGAWLEPIRGFGGDPERGHNELYSATLSGVYSYAMTGGIRKEQYKIKNFRIWSDAFVTEDAYGNVIPKTSNSTLELYGLFGRVNPFGTVEGITFENVALSNATAQYNVNRENIVVGIVAARNYGTVRDIVVDMKNVSFSIGNSIKLKNFSFGGLVGENYGDITEKDNAGNDSRGQIYATGTMSVSAPSLDQFLTLNIGGIVGNNYGKLSGKVSSSTILQENLKISCDATLVFTSSKVYDPIYGQIVNVGGIAGQNNGHISDFASENVIANMSRGNTGGLVGVNNNTSARTEADLLSGAIIEYCYSNSAIYARGVVGGLVGMNDRGTIKNSYYDFYINTRVKGKFQESSLLEIIDRYGSTNLDIINNPIYAGIIVDESGSNSIIGGVVGRNRSGRVLSSFSSSAFDNNTTNVLGTTFKGDIYILGANNVNVGGVVGQTEGLLSGNYLSSLIMGCYSNLSIFYEGDDGIAAPPRIGGLVGRVDTSTNASFRYCFSNITVRIEQDSGAIKIGGIMAENYCTASNEGLGINFVLCYSMLDASSVSNYSGEWTEDGRHARIDPIMPTAEGSYTQLHTDAVKFDCVLTTDDTLITNSGIEYIPANQLQNLDLSVNSWYDGEDTRYVSASQTYDNPLDVQPSDARNMGTYFMNSKNNAGYSDIGDISYNYPLIKDIEYFEDGTFRIINSPLYIAVPKTITVALKSDSALKSLYGAQRNNMGTFNYVVRSNNTTSSSALGTEARAALFFTNKEYVHTSAFEANRYYLDDLFTVKVSPQLAEKRLGVQIEGVQSADPTNPDATVVDLRTDTDINGLPRYFLLVRGLGSFKLVIYSTRSTTEPPLNTAVNFDVVESVNVETVSTPSRGEVGRRTLLIGPKLGDNTYPLASKVTVQKGTLVTFEPKVDSSAWSIKAERSYFAATTFPIPDSVINQAFDPETGIDMDGIGHTKVKFTPVISVGGIEYICSDLAITIEIESYGGARNLYIQEDEIVINGVSRTHFYGEFETDLDLVEGYASSLASKYMVLQSQLTPEMYLTDLLSFYFTKDSTGERMKIFTGGKSRAEIKDSQGFSLVLELSTSRSSVDGGDYTNYSFKILVSVQIDERIYSDISYANTDNATFVDAITKGLSGMLELGENRSAYQSSLSPKIYADDARVEVFGQALHSADVTHFSRTTAVEIDENTYSAMSIEYDRNQKPSNLLYVERGIGGMLEINTAPYFANISSATITSSYYPQLVGYKSYTSKGEPVISKDASGNPRTYIDKYGNELLEDAEYQYWQVIFRQMVYNAETGNYDSFVPYSSDGVISEYDVDGALVLRQVSSRRGNNSFDHDTYSWDGTYYLQTLVKEPDGGAIVKLDDSALFYITAQFVSKTYSKQTGLYSYTSTITSPLMLTAYERPGINFEYENSVRERSQTMAEQAVGTTQKFRIARVGNTKVSFGTGYEVDITIPSVLGNITPQYRVYSSVAEPTSEVVLTYLDPQDYGEGWYELYIAPTVRYNIATPISLAFKFDTQENKINYAGTSILAVHPVLFEVKGLEFDEPFANTETLRLLTTSRYTARLRAVTEHTDEPALADDIKSAIEDFELRINIGEQSENLLWIAGGEVLNRSYNADSELYESSDSASFNLGRTRVNGVATERFLIASLNDYSTTSMRIDLFYEYSLGKPVIRASAYLDRVISSYFEVRTSPVSAESLPIPVQTRTEFENMREGFHYILMNDLTLTDYVPRPFVALSFDGNNKKIYLNSFNLVARPTEIGLFSTIAQGRVVMNINLVIPKSLNVDISAYTTTTMISIGGVVGQNNGIITNCAVICVEQFGGKDASGADVPNYMVNYDKSTFSGVPTRDTRGSALARIAVYVSNPSLKLQFGGLVGNNAKDGVISNSRAMVDIYVNGDQVDSVVTSVAQISVAGFAGANAGIIVSSFFRDANVVNYAAISDSPNTSLNKTAGFVAANTGTVKTSYAQGSSTNFGVLGKSSLGEIIGRNPIAGFVWENAGGLVEDCYANIVLTWNITSGFVYQNPRGIIRNSFANCEFGVLASSDFIAEQTDKTVSSTVENCRYFGSDSINISSLNQLTIEHFSGFSISKNDDAHKWQFVAGKVPRLVSANDIAVSIREFVGGQWYGNYSYEYTDFGLGTKKNPIIIWNGAQFNSSVYIYSGAKGQDEEYTNSQTLIDFEKNEYGLHMRLVNNISLSGTELDDSTYKNLQTYKTTFKGTLDGNGLAIKDISLTSVELVAFSSGVKSIGLFSKVEYATVKNVSLRYAATTYNSDAIQALNFAYAGGLAGVAINSNLIDIDLLSQNDINASVTAANIAGGLVGVAVYFDNNYKIDNITSALSANSYEGRRSTYPSFSTAEDYMRNRYASILNGTRGLSVAGGVIGFATNYPLFDRAILYKDVRGNEITNLNYKNIYPTFSNLQSKGSQLRIQAEIAGGVIGVVDSGVTLRGANYIAEVTSNGSTLPGNPELFLDSKFYAGVIAGANFGTIINNISRDAGVQGRTETNVAGLVTRQNTFVSISISAMVGDYISVDDRYGVDSHHGIVFGGVAGFNNGTISGVNVNISMLNSNTLASGGVVGENIGGTLDNCSVSGDLFAGLYLGGVVGVGTQYNGTCSVNLATNGLFNTALTATSSNKISGLFVTGSGRALGLYHLTSEQLAADNARQKVTSLDFGFKI